jgi:hypothetical protein
MLVVFGFLNREDRFVQTNNIPTILMGKYFPLSQQNVNYKMSDNEIIRKCLGLESMKQKGN